MVPSMWMWSSILGMFVMRGRDERRCRWRVERRVLGVETCGERWGRGGGGGLVILVEVRKKGLDMWCLFKRRIGKDKGNCGCEGHLYQGC